MKLKAIKGFNLYQGSQIFKAMSDESRVRILHLIHHTGEMCISDLEHILDFTQTKTSRHLSYLKNAGLLQSKKNDQWVYYSIKEEFKDIVSQLFNYLHSDSTLEKDLSYYNTLYANNNLAIRKYHNQQKKYQLPEL